MITRNSILEEACERCLQELYENAQPKVSWEDFVKQNKDWKEGPRPYEFYYLPKDIFKDIVENYYIAYRLTPEFRDNVQDIINYFNDPIVLVYEERKSYKHFTPLKDIIGEEAFREVNYYLDRACKFFRRDREYQQFNMAIYLGASPSTNKESVIKNWKEYRNKDIEIDDSIWEDHWG